MYVNLCSTIKLYFVIPVNDDSGQRSNHQDLNIFAILASDFIKSHSFSQSSLIQKADDFIFTSQSP